MKFKALALVLLASAAAHAESATWTARKISVSFAPMESAISCDYAQAELEGVLKQLGAREVSVRCSGGLEDHSPFVDLTATFTSAAIGSGAHSEPAAFHGLKFAGHDDECDMHESFIKQALPQFTTQKIVDDSNCYNWQGDLSVSLSVLK